MAHVGQDAFAGLRGEGRDDRGGVGSVTDARPQTSAARPRWPGGPAAGSAVKTAGIPSAVARARRALMFSTSSTTGDLSVGTMTISSP